MVKISDPRRQTRIEAIREEFISRPPGICSERLRCFTDAYQKYEHQPAIIKRALALSEYLARVSLFFDERTLIPGNSSSHPRWAAIFPEYSWEWVYDEVDRFDLRNYDRYTITPEVKEDLANLLPWWRGRSLYERVLQRQPRDVLDASEAGVLSWTGQATSGEGHIIVDHTIALESGYEGIKEKAIALRKNLPLYEPDSLEKREFYNAVEIVCDGVIRYAGRLRDFLKEHARKEEDAERKEEISGIISDLSVVPAKPAATFRQALITVWLTHMILQMESNGHSFSLGRCDQYLFPFFEKDIKEGILTEEGALELIEHFFLKLFSIIKLRPEKHSRTQSGYPMYQNIAIGGLTPDGTDATNVLSYLFLSALAEVRLSEPNLYVRLHQNTSDKFLREALNVVGLGFGIPAFVNDEIIVESLERRGVARSDALNYSTMGCLEVQVPGKWGYRANGKSKVNMLKILELALHNGNDPLTGKSLNKEYRQSEFLSFDEILAAWRSQLDHFTELHVIADNIIDHALCELTPNAFCSMLVRDCLPRGHHLNRGGAVYDMTSGCLVGTPNVGNALAALKKAVYDEGWLTLDEIKTALKANFTGTTAADVRDVLLNKTPKFGEDQDEADELTALALDDYCECISRYKNMRHGLGPIGGGYYASTVTVSANVTAGDMVGATPDGRLAHEPTADGISPAQGCGKNGLTAVIQSVAKLPTVKVTGGQLLNIRLQDSILKSVGGMARIMAVMRALVDLRCWHVQFNTISTEVLRDAILHPENYRDLIVRVAGYSALFTALDPVLQQDIIARMEHSLI